MKNLLLAFFLLLASISTAQSPLGVWKTIDDETGEAKSHIEVFEQGGKVYGKVVKLLKSAPDKKCDKCPGDRKDQPLMGMILLTDLKMKDGYYQGGSILDPEKGKWYNCKVWLKDGDPNALSVRGSVGPFYRTQTWYRVQ
jgi:uncharacterized protein (DUF2147 family)